MLVYGPAAGITRTYGEVAVARVEAAQEFGDRLRRMLEVRVENDEEVMPGLAKACQHRAGQAPFVPSDDQPNGVLGLQ